MPGHSRIGCTAAWGCASCRCSSCRWYGSNPSLLHVGDLNLLGLLNPLAQVPASRLLWGEVAGWTTDQQILWGTTIYNPQGQQILWGTSADGDQILWGTSTDTTMTALDPR